MTPEELGNAICAFASARHYHAATVERWRALPLGDAQMLLTVATELRLGENQLGDLWEWAEEIAARDGMALAEVFDSPAVRRARQRRVGRNDRVKLIKAELRRCRYPQLAALEARLQTLIRELELPRGVRVHLPVNLEGDRLTIELNVDSSAGLKSIAAALDRAAGSAACTAIFALLEEAP